MKFTTQVIKGQGRGKTLGFPTFNLRIPQDFSAKQGIYAGWVWINNQKYIGAFHSGPIPVFAQPQARLEVFVLDYDNPDPISTLSFELIHYLRPVKNFASPQALARQISRDVAQVRAALRSQTKLA